MDQEESACELGQDRAGRYDGLEGDRTVLPPKGWVVGRGLSHAER